MDAMEKNSRDVESDEKIELPPGFRFHPTDEELITHYLSQKVLNNSFCAIAIGEADLNKCEPWDLPCKFLFSLPLIPFFFKYWYQFLKLVCNRNIEVFYSSSTTSQLRLQLYQLYLTAI